MFTAKKTKPQKKLSFRLLTIALFLFSIFSFYGAASAANWYVNGDIGTSGNGTTWSEAFTTLQDAIDAASEDDEIWVKKGTYLLSAQINVDKTVGIYGGFAGDEIQRSQRDWANNVTTIDGQGSVYHCFYITANATIDGLTITRGNANGSSPDYRGGGIYVYQSSPSITNCTISQNTADFGGGINNRKSSPTITSCIFTGNITIKSGGGIYNYQSTPTITNCTFSGNSATNNGGGMYNNDNASPSITNCTFIDNTAEFGGGVFNNDNATPTITNCTLRGNSAAKSGGGMYNNDNTFPTIISSILSDNSASWGSGIFNDNSSPTIINCTLSKNSATSYGGGIRNKNTSTPAITNSILWNNTAPDGPEIYNDDTSNPIINYCNIQGGYAGQENINANPLFVDPSNNDFHIQATSPCIDKGNNSAAGIPNTDFDGNSRIVDGDNDGTATVDIGADEYEYTSSVTADGDLAPLGNRDGKVDVGDALVALRFALMLETPTQEDIDHGDVAPLDASGLPHPDGNIDVGDALVILRKALGIISFEPTELGGIWGLYTTTTGETREDGPMIMVLLESGTTLSLETMGLDGTWINGTGTINGTQISLSWEEEGKTVSLTGTVTNGTMSGTWTDTSGDSGTWRAERALELGEAQITFPETGDELIKIEEEFGFGSATIYGTETEQGPAFPLTGFTITTTDGDCVVSLDDQERPVEMTLGTMEVDFTYNLDDSFNYELEEDGVLIYNGAAISTGENGLSGSRSWTMDTAPLSDSRYYGAEDSIREANVRSGDDEALFEDVVSGMIAIRGKNEYDLPKTHPFIKKMQQNPQLVNLINIFVMNMLLCNRLVEKHGFEKAIEACIFLKEFSNGFVKLQARDIMNNEWDDYNGGKDYDLDKDGFTENQGDCNDRNEEINPDATEVCNGIDDNCENGVDEGVKITYYMDSDGDGYGDPMFPTEACKAPAHCVTDNTDCNDSDANEHPGQIWYKDADNDGYSDATILICCPRPNGYKATSDLTSTSVDCDDANSSINPSVAEVCNGIDDNCDGQTDEGVKNTYYMDSDGDGYGDPMFPTEACTQPVGYVTDNTDCNDKNPDEKPGQGWYKDADYDGYSDWSYMTSCKRPNGYKLATELTGTEADCRDDKPLINPGATEVCDDNKDNDCDTLTDCDDPDCATHPNCQPEQCTDPNFPQPCDNACIPAGVICCNYGTGTYCPSEAPKCCPGGCCMYKCCGLGCCNIPGTYCCPSGQCCCLEGDKCCEGGGCCKVNEQCCGGKCCIPGSHCAGGQCVAN
ncbi:MAG: MopE-related protein [Thermodesulfobacteriota bacterium]|nr:MopE-related protein [Thermodesulfobacteriota bacterium]